MKKLTQATLIIELNLILLFLIFVIYKLNTLDHKVYNTNKFVYEVLADKRIEDFNTTRDNDIVVGDLDAPVSLFLYSRFDCSACNDFFVNNYYQLKDDFINDGKVKLIIRYLVHHSKKEPLFATKCAYYAYENNFFDSYLDQIISQYPIMDTVMIRNSFMDLTNDNDAINGFLLNKTIEKRLLQSTIATREVGIRATPTIFINGKSLIGNRRYSKIKEMILSELENESCD